MTLGSADIDLTRPAVTDAPAVIGTPKSDDYDPTKD